MTKLFCIIIVNMSDIFEQEFSLIEILKNEPKEPFSIKLNVKCKNETTEELFSKIKDIFLKGLMIQSGDEFKNSINIKDIDMKHIDIMKRHMLSMGIDVKLREYNAGTKDYLFKNLLYDIQNIKNIEIKVLKDWNSDLIEKININLKITDGDLSVIQKYNNAIKKHYEANHFLRLNKPDKLHDYAIFVKSSEESDTVNVLYFDFAKRHNIEHIHKNLMFSNC